MSVMKSLAILVLVGTATTLFADTFTIERNDPRPFRIHRGPDETAATKAMIDELAREVKRGTVRDSSASGTRSRRGPRSASTSTSAWKVLSPLDAAGLCV